MYTMITYKGTQNNIKGMWCGHRPEDAIIEQEITVYRADEGKVFIKDGNKYSAVILQDGESIEDYQEIEDAENTDE